MSVRKYSHSVYTTQRKQKKDNKSKQFLINETSVRRKSRGEKGESEHKYLLNKLAFV